MSYQRTIFRLASACAAVGLVAVLPAFGETLTGAGVSARFELAWASRYVWRGIPQTKSWALQPSVTLAHESGLSFNYWASRDADKADFTENDYTLSYSRQAGETTVNAGVVHYAFPNTSSPATSEVYVGLANGGAFSPSLTVNWDFDEADGVYAAVGVSRSVPVSNGARELQFTARLGGATARYNGYWFGVHSAALSDVYVGTSLPFRVGEVTLTPSLGWSSLISKKLRNSPNMQGLKRDSLIFGLAAGIDL